MDYHKDYEEHLEYWQQVRRFVKGKKDIQKYLRTISPGDNSTDNILINKEYKDGAVYLNVSARTRNALVGAVFRKDAKVELPPQIEYLRDNANGGGLSLTQLAKNFVGNNVEIGRHGALVDYPRVEGSLSLEEQTQLGIGAKITGYDAETIVAWETDSSGNLKSVTLYEGKNEEDKKIYRKLGMDESGYFQQMYLDDDEDGEPVYPTRNDGSKWGTIPFVIMGSEDNSPDVDIITMWDIVAVSAGHYRNSADYEELLHLIGNPTLAATVPNKTWMDALLPDGYKIGGRGFVPLPENGTAMILEVSPTQVHAEAMKQKEAQMVMIGARLIESGQAVETAEAVKIRYSGENSVLDNLAQNVSAGIKQCLIWAAEFMGGSVEEIEYELNRDFFETSLSPQEIMAYVQLKDEGVIALSDMRVLLRKGGKIAADRTDEEIDEEASGTNPLA